MLSTDSMGGLATGPPNPPTLGAPRRSRVAPRDCLAFHRGHAGIIPGTPGPVDAWRPPAASSMLVSHDGPSTRLHARHRGAGVRQPGPFGARGRQAAAPGADAVAETDRPDGRWRRVRARAGPARGRPVRVTVA